MLHQRVGHDHIAHPHPRMQAARQPGEDHPRHPEFLDHDGCRGRGRHLADTAERDHAGRAPQGAHLEIAHGDAARFRAGIHGRQQVGDFFVQRAQNGETSHVCAFRGCCLIVA
ncbi:hypothetical protein D3C72_2203030 [compost metagenome]